MEYGDVYIDVMEESDWRGCGRRGERKGYRTGWCVGGGDFMPEFGDDEQEFDR